MTGPTLSNLGSSAVAALVVMGTQAIITDYPAGVIVASGAAAFVGWFTASLVYKWMLRRRSNRHL